MTKGRAGAPETREPLRALGYVVADAAESSASAAEPAAVQVRHDFRSTALWIPDLVTDDRGEARIEVPFPDSLTGWRATARAADRRTRVGIARTAVRTRKPLLVRLETPRFLVVGDVATLSASIHNDTDQKLAVIPSLVASGLSTEGDADTLSIPAHGEGRVEWTASAREAGEATLEISVRGGNFSDAMRRSLPIYAHGIEKLETVAGKLRGAELRAGVTLPERRRSTRLEILVAPSLAVAMLDALPYLIEYPYGCTEQTMLGLRKEDVVGRVFGGIEPEHAAKTHPRGSEDLDELDAVVRSGLARLADLQHGDGGFGWWKPGASDPFMTAYVAGGPGDAGEGPPLPGAHPRREDGRARHPGVDAPRPRGPPRLQLGASPVGLRERRLRESLRASRAAERLLPSAPHLDGSRLRTKGGSGGPGPQPRERRRDRGHTGHARPLG
jgi:uncharacterized protein YfaS (alpha-2-macroglobulin family)